MLFRKNKKFVSLTPTMAILKETILSIEVKMDKFIVNFTNGMQSELNYQGNKSMSWRVKETKRILKELNK